MSARRRPSPRGPKPSVEVEHFFCQHATAEEGVPPPSPERQLAAPLEPEAELEPAGRTAPPVGAEPLARTPDNGLDGGAGEVAEAEARRPLEYWDYDENLWCSSPLDEIQAKGGTARRDSLTSDEPSEPPCLCEEVEAGHTSTDSVLTAWSMWSEYEQDYSVRRESLSLSECAVPCP